MAIMYPSFDVPGDLEQYLPANSYGNGQWWERMLYDEMRDELPADWTVVHHRNLNDGQFRHECDFLVIVPGKGIVNLDAKGHGWGCANARWFRVRNGQKEPDDPIDQAEKAIRTLDSVLRAKVSDGNNWGGFGYLLVFSESINNPAVEESFLDNAERQIHNGRKAWGKKLKDKIEEILDCPAPSKNHYFFTDQMRKAVLSFLVPVSTPSQVDDKSFRIWDGQSREALSYKQKRVSAELKNNDVVHVVGAAGTGKTVVALALLEEFRQEGKTALYVCFNKALCSILKSENPSLAGSGKIALTHFDAIPSLVLPNRRELRKIVRFPFAPADSRKHEWDNYRAGIRSALDHFSENQSGVFDLVVVDEAQDLAREDILSLYNLSGGERKIVVFSDKDQTIFSTEWDFSPSDFGEVSSVKLVLDENWRNSAPIHDHFKNYAEHEPPTTMICDCPKPVEAILDIGKTLGKLIRDEHRSPHDIVVLSSDWESIDGIVGPIGSTGVSVKKLEGDIAEFRRKNPKAVMAATIQGFKGLESRIVVLILGSRGRRTQDEWDKLRYVGESRAKYELYITDAANA